MRSGAGARSIAGSEAWMTGKETKEKVKAGKSRNLKRKIENERKKTEKRIRKKEIRERKESRGRGTGKFSDTEANLGSNRGIELRCRVRRGLGVEVRNQAKRGLARSRVGRQAGFGVTGNGKISELKN